MKKNIPESRLKQKYISIILSLLVTAFAAADSGSVSSSAPYREKDMKPPVTEKIMRDTILKAIDRVFNTAKAKLASDDKKYTADSIKKISMGDNSSLNKGFADVYYWDPMQNERGRWYGHITLMLEDKTYLSNWPADEELPSWVYIFITTEARESKYIYDYMGEDMRTPHHVRIYGLDTAAMKKWWHANRGRFSMWFSCATVVRLALKQGGVRMPWHFIDKPYFIWDDISNVVPLRGSARFKKN